MSTSLISPALDPAHPGHPQFICDHLCTQLLLLRKAKGLSAADLARSGLISSQTVINNELHTSNPGIVTLGIQSQLLGSSLTILLTPPVLPVYINPKILG